ncbi:MAG TPA: hypothetical protein VFV38_40055 [Ktedonobacteraceae bacterium]|nr:hypothetical protein [Ktedonobacteraceae bacterium]
MNNLIIFGGPETSKGRVEAVRSALHYTSELFSGKDEIWPDQCDYASSRLELVKALLLDYCRFLESSGCHSPFAPHQQTADDLTILLHYTREQLDEVRELVATFRPICRSSSKRAWQKRTEILSKLEQCIHHNDDLIYGITTLQKKRSHPSTGTGTRISPTPPRVDEGKSCQFQKDQSGRDQPPDKKARPPLTLIKGNSRETHYLHNEEASCS